MPVVTPATQAASKLAVTETVKNADGTVKVLVKISDSVLETELTKWTGSASRLLFQIPEAADEVELSITNAQLAKIIAKDATAIVEVQGIDKGFIIPGSVLKSAAGSDEQSSVILQATLASKETVESAKQLLLLQSLNAIGTPYEFSINVTNGSGASHEIKDTEQYIGHVFYIPQPSGVSADILSAVMIDTAGKQVITVPATFVQEGDKIKVTAYRKGNSMYTVVAGQAGFKDVSATHFASEAIGKLGARRIISGYTDSTFKPEGTVTRAEAAALLVKALGLTPVSADLNFKDVKKEAWYASAVATVVQSGLFKGYPDETFRPNQTITQQEMISIINQALVYGGFKSATDVTLQQFEASAGYKAWSKSAVDALIRAGVIKTSDVFPIQANKNTTRAESAVLIYRLLSVLKMI
ncbi:hypothetical protein PAECIP111892_03162 [Paenibacillus auburnensis]|uniref:SLH domain-containing protein n=1 Tax=Paenibacillus auburnensis TaxID=2905649 RepID=A0ABM9CD28_9BACL|nr:hypothetical protein PAECIP111892_03162 [Paenibacillus auburnensis]